MRGGGASTRAPPSGRRSSGAPDLGGGWHSGCSLSLSHAISLRGSAARVRLHAAVCREPCGRIILSRLGSNAPGPNVVEARSEAGLCETLVSNSGRAWSREKTHLGAERPVQNCSTPAFWSNSSSLWVGVGPNFGQTQPEVVKSLSTFGQRRLNPKHWPVRPMLGRLRCNLGRTTVGSDPTPKFQAGLFFCHRHTKARDRDRDAKKPSVEEPPRGMQP